MFRRSIAFEIPGGYNESSYVMGRDSMRFAQIAVRVWSWRMSQAHTGGVSVALGYFFTLIRYLALPVAWLESHNFP